MHDASIVATNRGIEDVDSCIGAGALKTAPRIVRVLVVQRDAGARKALEYLFDQPANGTVVAASCASVAEGPRLLQGSVLFDVALVELCEPVRQGIQFIQALRKKRSEAAIVVQASFEDPVVVRTVLCVGACGFFIGTPSELGRQMAFVREAAEGRVVLCPRTQLMLVEWLREKAAYHSGETPPRLFPRELEVLEMLSRGHTYQSIANTLSISLGTVQNCVKRIYIKLGACTKVEAAREAARFGLIP